MLNLVVHIEVTGFQWRKKITNASLILSFGPRSEHRIYWAQLRRDKHWTTTFTVCTYIHTLRTHMHNTQSHTAHQYRTIRTITSDMVQWQSAIFTVGSITVSFTLNKPLRCDPHNFQTLNIYSLSLPFLSTANKVSYPLKSSVSTRDKPP